MIVITHNYDIDKIRESTNSLDIQRVRLDKSVLKEQSEKLAKLALKCSKGAQRTLKNTAVNLDKTYSKIDSNDNFEFCWQYENGYIKSYPTVFIEEESMGLYMSDAVVSGVNQRVVHVSISDIKNLMALEYGKEQLGFNHIQLEEALDSIGITGMHEVDEMRKCIPEFDEMYMKCSKLNIENCEYIDSNGNMQGYFVDTNYKLCSASKYRNVIDSTCKIITTIIALDTLKCILKHDKSAVLLSVGKSSFTIITDDALDIGSSIDNVVMKALGRQWKIKCDVKYTV